MRSADRKSTRLNSSHVASSYAVFCLKKKKSEVRDLEAPLHPEDASHGTRKVPSALGVYVERDVFREAPPKDWFRLAPGRFFFHDSASTEIYTLSLHDALPI